MQIKNAITHRNKYRIKFTHGGNTIFNFITTYQLVIKKTGAKGMS